jgi:hypothetical protein
MNLFITGFTQVFFVVANTYFIGKQNYYAVAVCSTLISLIWTFNVKKIAFSGLKSQITYALGAGTGGVLSLYFSQIIL